MSFDALVQLCHYIGSRAPLWTQGPGSNVSYKHGHILYIKASGVRLDQVTQRSGIAAVNLKVFHKKLKDFGLNLKGDGRDLQHEGAEDAYAKALNEAICSTGRLRLASVERPSMETLLHAVLPAPFVIHMHSLPSILMAHIHQREPGRLDALFPTAWQGRVAHLARIHPGLMLGSKVAAHTGAKALILQNHGVILPCASPFALDEWRRIERQFCHAFAYHDLAELLHCPALAPRLAALAGQALPRLRYLPDVAVFAARLGEQLREVSFGLYKFAGDDPDMRELWQAQQLLYSAEAKLEQWPDAEVETLANMPLEKLRLSLRAS